MERERETVFYDLSYATHKIIDQDVPRLGLANALYNVHATTCTRKNSSLYYVETLHLQQTEVRELGGGPTLGESARPGRLYGLLTGIESIMK